MYFMFTSDRSFGKPRSQIKKRKEKKETKKKDQVTFLAGILRRVNIFYIFDT